MAVAACTGPQEPEIQRLIDGHKMHFYRLHSLVGVRDGALLPVIVTFRAPEATLTMTLHFRIGVPTELESGHYRWEQERGVLQGPIRATSVTFLGGQSDRPNLGGVFQLLSANRVPLYRVKIPTMEVARPGTPAIPPQL